MTLTTETLNDFIAGQGFGVAPSAVEAMARELLANRGAQPVAGEFIPKNLDAALGVVGVAIPESREEFNFQTERYIQRLIDRVIRYSDEFTAPPAPAVPDDTRDALRYRFLKDKDAWGCDNEPSLVEWDDLIDLEGSEFDAAIDARIANSDVDYAATPAPAVTAHAIIAAIEAEQERLFGEDYLMDSKDCIDVIREMLAAAPEGGN
ncbi:hypothetical protein ACLPHD_06580 [Serratia odorifera]|uniref:hypothetical protein n=1 Tax=Serratia odorifera TaxID=618 RepID=UPI003D27738D